MTLKCGVLLSGSGTTLENIFERIEQEKIDASIEIVIGTKDSAYGLVRAQNRGVPTAVVKPGDFENTEVFSDELTRVLDQYNAGLVILAGFMFLYRIPEAYAGKVMNIHPALIPAFCGKGFYGHHVHEAVLARGVKITGCTVHFVDNVYDHGPIILQKAVEVKDDDTPDSLAERVQAAEREAYPEAVRLFSEGRLSIENGKVRIADNKDLS